MPLRPDLISTRESIASGASARAQMDESLRIARGASCDKVFLRTTFDQALAACDSPGAKASPLAGLAISIKDLFDIEGQPTAAGSRALADAAPARADCPAVARLKAAGGAIVGRTNMSEFAFSGVGINPHFGTPANPADTATPRIPGGSSSGAAVSVAAGACFVGLGSDTGGSIRIPAALCGIVGFKNTARLVPTDGALPLSTTLDTVCAMTRSVRDAVLAHEVLAARKVALTRKPLAAWKLAVASIGMLDGLDATVARAFDRTLAVLRDKGAQITEISLDAIAGLGAIQATGGFSAAESYAWHRKLLAAHGNVYDHRVKARILRGEKMTAWEYIELTQARAAWIASVEKDLARFDAVLSPTCPIVAPPIAQANASDEAFFAINAQLLRNTSVVNMLDGCAISIPCNAPDELPVGLMIWHGALHDDAVLDIALQAEAALAETSE